MWQRWPELSSGFDGRQPQCCSELFRSSSLASLHRESCAQMGPGPGILCSCSSRLGALVLHIAKLRCSYQLMNRSCHGFKGGCAARCIPSSALGRLWWFLTQLLSHRPAKQVLVSVPSHQSVEFPVTLLPNLSSSCPPRWGARLLK